jgi:hypothetical protein
MPNLKNGIGFFKMKIKNVFLVNQKCFGFGHDFGPTKYQKIFFKKHFKSKQIEP